MLENIQSVAVQVLILFILVGIGMICRYMKILNDTSVKGMSDLVLYLITPANIIVAFQREFRMDLLRGLGISFLLAFTVFTCATIVAKLVIREKNDDKKAVLRFAAAYPNAGYMGIPLQRAILGDIGVFYCAAYIAMFHMYVWTYGVNILSPSGEPVRVRLKKVLMSPCIIAVFIGLLLFFTSTTLPTVIYSPISSLAALATPVPMIIIGYYLAGSNLKQIFGNGYIYVAAGVKMIISPIIALALCRLIGVTTELAVSCLIACSASSAAMTTMLATKYKRDTEVSAGMVSFTTIAAIITMPVFIALAQML